MFCNYEKITNIKNWQPKVLSLSLSLSVVVFFSAMKCPLKICEISTGPPHEAEIWGNALLGAIGSFYLDMTESEKRQVE